MTIADEASMRKVGSGEVLPLVDAGDVQRQTAATEIPALFQIVGAEVPLIYVGALPSDALTSGQKITIDRWVFGQHNKLLPLKASIRALANLSLGVGGGVPLTKAATEIARASESLRHTFEKSTKISVCFVRRHLQRRSQARRQTSTSRACGLRISSSER